MSLPPDDRVFLDANVLFSAAIGGKVGGLWSLPGVTLVTSTYAVAEAARNLAAKSASADEIRERGARLTELALRMEIIDSGESTLPLAAGRLPNLPDPTDLPILIGAITAGATHLVSGDATCFGSLFGTRVLGVLILRRAAYLASRRDA